MKDNEIIKTLECCLNADSLFECYECNYYGKEHCLNSMIIDALDLINRQKAEIERLEIKNRGCTRSKCNKGYVDGIKEFAEELIKQYSTELDGYYGEIVWADDIDNLVKEMVGEG